MNTTRAGLLIAAASLASFACGTADNPHFDDNLDFEVQLFTSHDTLHTPYIVGTNVTIYAEGNKSEVMTIESDDPNVLRIDSQDQGRAECTAVSEGDVTLSLVLADRRVHSTTVAVRNPVRAELHTQAIRNVLPEANEPTPHVLVGGSAVFIVRYFDQDDRLIFGNGVLELQPSADLVAEPAIDTFLEKRDWARVTPQVPGPHQLVIGSGGVVLSTIEIIGVDDGALDHIALLQPADADPDEYITVVGLAQDAAGSTIHGVPYTWDVEGSVIGDPSDLFSYTYRESASIRQLQASYGSQSATIAIRGDDTHTADTADALGCQVAAPGRAGYGVGLLALMGLLFAVRRRKPAPRELQL